MQKKLADSQSKHRHRNNHEYLLSGVLRCGDCGGRMTGTSGTSQHGRSYYYYHCVNKHFGRINAELLEKTVFDVIDDYLQSDKIKTVAKVAYDEYQKQIMDNTELTAVRKEIKKSNSKLQNAVNAVLNGFQSETIKNSISELESKIKELSFKEEELKRRAPVITLEMFETAIKCFSDTPSASLIDCVIKRIDFFGSFIVVYFRLFDVDGTDPDKIKIMLKNKGTAPNTSVPLDFIANTHCRFNTKDNGSFNVSSPPPNKNA